MSMQFVRDEAISFTPSETTNRQYQIEVKMTFPGDKQLYPFCRVYASTEASASMKADLIVEGLSK